MDSLLPRILVGIVVALGALVSYFMSSEVNPVTGEKQYISLSPDQEIALGLQAVPQMIEQHGGVYPNDQLQARVDEVGMRLVRENDLREETPWQFEFYLLADEQLVNAFALPGGQIFITKALYDRLESEDQLAGVLGHEIGHVIARHSAERIAKSQLTQGLTGAVAVASGDATAAQAAAMVGQMVNMKYGRDDELQSDFIGVDLMIDAGYDPEALIGVMDILQEASGGGAPEFMSTHPNPDNRRERIRAAIEEHRR